MLILNSPFAYPKTAKEWQIAEQLEATDPMIAPGAIRFMLKASLKADPETPAYVPVFKESRRDFNRQIRLLKSL